jgi:hypothetical protein
LKVAKKKKKLVEDEEGCDLATLVALTSRNPTPHFATHVHSPTTSEHVMVIVMRGRG